MIRAPHRLVLEVAWNLRRLQVSFLRKRLFTRSLRYFRDAGIAPLAERRITGETAPLEELGDKISDLARLHRLVLKKRARRVLEFGSGLSTVVMADAVAKVSKATGREGRIHAVEGSPEWAGMVRDAVPENLKPYVEVTASPVETTLVNGELCHVFRELPDVNPDFLYLDGPAREQIEGSVRGLSFSEGCPIVAADPLFYESRLYPGFMMVVDGRTANTLFLRRNLKRRYRFRRDRIHRAHTFVLKAKPDFPERWGRKAPTYESE
jgi:hypothetical protein